MRVIITEFSPLVEKWFQRSWQRILAVGIALVIGGLLVLSFPKLVAFLVALGLFILAAVFFVIAINLRKLVREGTTTHIHVD